MREQLNETSCLSVLFSLFRNNSDSLEFTRFFVVRRGRDGAKLFKMRNGTTSKLKGRAPSRPPKCQLMVHCESRPRRRVALQGRLWILPHPAHLDTWVRCY